jgi:hypothetical protein
MRRRRVKIKRTPTTMPQWLTQRPLHNPRTDRHSDRLLALDNDAELTRKKARAGTAVPAGGRKRLLSKFILSFYLGIGR